MKQFRRILSYVSQLGVAWILFRLCYELQRRLGVFDWRNRRILNRVNRFSKTLKVSQWPEWGGVDRGFRSEWRMTERADRAMVGEIFSFSSQYLNFNPDGQGICWQYSPKTGVTAAAHLPWHRMGDFTTLGDIKVVWEVSRFPQVFYFIQAYSVTHDERYAQACLRQISEWIECNPFPFGVNYKCGQEMAFRLMVWCLALDYFADFVTNELKLMILPAVYTALLRIESNIGFAMYSVRNNHSVSEAAGLLIGGLLFPSLPGASRFVEKGCRFLQRELGYQVYADGSYIQHSMMYQRLVVDVLSMVIWVSRRCHFELPKSVCTAQEKLLMFLLTMMQPDGQLPNYGANDGANLFPMGDEKYRDFRSSLNLAWGVLFGERLFEGHDEMLRFWGVTLGDVKETKSAVLGSFPPCSRFDDGGYYVLRRDNCFVMLRAHRYRHRPGHCDMLHADVWMEGRNVFCDSGSFSYNDDPAVLNQFKGNVGHNTVMVNGMDQMETASRFGYARWVNSRVISVDDTQIVAEHDGYVVRLGVLHRRTLRWESDGNRLIVEDELLRVRECRNPVREMVQIWNTTEPVSVLSECSVKVGDVVLKSSGRIRVAVGSVSEYYNLREPATRLWVYSGADFKISSGVCWF